MKIFVGNLSNRITTEALQLAFAAHGQVTSVDIIKDKFSGESKGFGFVEMLDNASADTAIKSLDGTPLGGRNMKVNQAKPREERPARSARY